MIYNCDSHVGKVRKNNEDYCMGEIIQTDDECIGIFALADGMGGHKKGEVASKIAVESIIDFLKENISKSSGIKMDYLDDVINRVIIMPIKKFMLNLEKIFLVKVWELL